MATATKEILDTIEETIDVMDETLNMMDKFPRRNKFVIGGVILASLVTGAVVGYFLTRRHERIHWSKLAAIEIEEAKEYYAARQKTGTYSDPVKLAEKYVDENDMRELREITEPYQSPATGIGLHEVIGEVKEVNDTEDGVEVKFELSPEVAEVFTQDAHVFDISREIRTEEAPYVISYDEFMECEKDYNQSTLAWYENDNVLADEQDKPIENIDRTVGEYNLDRFGHGSKDNNVVYIRNEVLEHEFEVIRHRGSYVEQVLGFIQHGDRHRPRKFRSDDD
jgi:hypothetical protein